MPLQHRVGDKKRYHYGGGSSGRYSAHGRSSGLVNNGSSSSLSHDMSGSGSNSGTASPTHHTASRPSRYDPTASNRPSSSSSRPGSRFNPNISHTETSQPGLKRSVSDNNTSRWVGFQQQSRYNPQIPAGTAGSSKIATSGSSGPSTAPGTSSYYNSYYPNNSNQHHYFSSRTARPRSSFESFPHSSTDIYEPKQALNESTYKNKPKTMPSSSLINSRGSYWRGSRVNNFQGGSRYNGFRKNEYNSDDTYDLSKTQKLPDKNSHSSSLINSVPQISKKEMTHQEHKQIDINSEQFIKDADTKIGSEIQVSHPEDQYVSKLNPDGYVEKNVVRNIDHLESKINARELELNSDEKLEANHDSAAEEPPSKISFEEGLDPDLEPEKLVREDKEEMLTVTTEDIHEELDEDMAEQMNTIQETTFQETVRPLLESSHIPPADVLPGPTPYPEPITPVDSCIFPMKESEMKLWLLKNQTRSQITRCQKYLLKEPIKYLIEYPFFRENWVIHRQAVRPVLVKNVAKVKRYEHLRKLQLKDQFLKLQKQWEVKCAKMDESSESMRKAESEEQEKMGEPTLENDKPKNSTQQRPTSSRRRNRADFVDDNDIENVLLQIDPEYKHHQLAATIPPMVINPLRKHAMKFKDVNNLVTDKETWASRILTDPVDTFTPYEHELFVEGYLAYPKKFGKISNYMGGLRTPEECVMHYYITKKSSNYKKLLLEKNKKRKSNVGRRKKERVDLKKRETEDDVSPVDSVQINNIDENEHAPSAEGKFEEQKISSNTNEYILKGEDIRSDTESEHEDAVESEVLINRANTTEEFQIFQASKSVGVQDIETKGIDDNLTDVANNADQGEHGSNIKNEVTSHISEGSEEMREDQQPPKKRLKHSDATHKSSYWSVQESKRFPELLKEFGTDWMAISQKLGTKSTTMVKNYFQRKAEQNGWLSLVESVDRAKSPSDLYAQMISSKPVSMTPAPKHVIPDALPSSLASVIEGKRDETVTIQPMQQLPHRQMPAVGYFTENRLPAINKPFTSAGGNEESFSRLPTPTHGLPPQHMPVISSFNIPKVSSPKLGSSANSANTPQTRTDLVQSASIPQPYVHFSSEVRDQPPTTQPSQVESSRRSSIRSLLNDGEDSESKVNLPSTVPFSSTKTSNTSTIPILRPLTSALTAGNGRPIVSANGSNVIVQELNSGFNQKPFHQQNIASASAIQPHMTTYMPMSAPADLSHHQSAASLNFANDPLAALAAVASSETLGLLPTNSQPSQSDNNADRPTTNY